MKAKEIKTVNQLYEMTLNELCEVAEEIGVIGIEEFKNREPNLYNHAPCKYPGFVEAIQIKLYDFQRIESNLFHVYKHNGEMGIYQNISRSNGVYLFKGTKRECHNFIS